MKYRMTDIENFVAASSSPTLMEAARKLEISQPALSESIKRLESDLGCSLFYRSRSGIQLTPDGKLMLAKARQVVQSVLDLEKESDDQAIFGGRTISVGAHLTVANYSIPKALALLKASAPDYRVALKHDLSRNLQRDIQHGTLDIGIVINPVRVPDLVIQRLDYDTVGVWHAKTANPEKDTIICNPNLFQTQSILKKWKGRPERVIETDGLDLICRLVSENLGYGILPERAVGLSKFNLVKASNLPTYQDEICLVHRPEFGKTPPERMVIEALKKSIVG